MSAGAVEKDLRALWSAALAKQPYWSGGSLRQLVSALDSALGAVGGAMLDGTRSGELTAVDGVFADDPVAGAVTASRWLERARAGLLVGAAQPLESAHIAISGLAVSDVDPVSPGPRR